MPFSRRNGWRLAAEFREGGGYVAAGSARIGSGAQWTRR